jgi:hypothetical protein
MLIKIGEFECTECWDGVFYKKLANYPVITEWEIQTVLDFEHYEKQNGRDCLGMGHSQSRFNEIIHKQYRHNKNWERRKNCPCLLWRYKFLVYLNYNNLCVIIKQQNI